jgi:hypothetical protein
MKKNKILRLGLLALALTLVTGSLVSGTFAKYVTTVTGTGTVTVAKWAIKVGETAATAGTVKFKLASTITDATGVAADLIAPGTAGKFSLVYSTTDTQVAHKVTLALDTANSSIEDLEHLQFKTDTNTTWRSFAELGTTDLQVDTYAAGLTATDKPVYVYWQWPFVNADHIDYDKDDTAKGIAGGDYELLATFTAEQLDTNP